MKKILLTLGLFGAGSGFGANYYSDVKPIFDVACSTCHGDDKVAFSFDSWQKVYPLRFAIKNAIQAKRMPVWLPAPGHKEYYYDRSLNQQQLDTLEKWFAAGFPEGDPADRNDLEPPAREIEPDMVLETFPGNMSYTPDQENKDDYRCFIQDWPEATTKYISGFQFNPGNLKNCPSPHWLHC